MQKLKLNQLNKQKVADREMNAIEGGGLPAQFENYEAMSKVCGCNDSQFLHHPQHDYHLMWGMGDGLI